LALVPALYQEHYLASVPVRLPGAVERVVVCDDGSVDLTGSTAEAMGATVVRHGFVIGYR
jgi:glycosyltransferase involved in cell wall biosynthesis